MDDRRTFLKTMAMAAAAVSAPRSVLGQNDKVRMAVIGTGTRGQMVTRFFMTHPDCEFVAACDVRKTRLEQAMKAIGGKVEGYGDYRRILDRKDIDAVLVTTPDHWHGPIVAQACAAGKDAYVEKPMTHTIEDALMAVEAAKKYKRVVQLGVQQRSGAHFQECAKMIQDGYIGKVSHCVLNQPGSYGGVMQPTAPVPEDLDWEMFQGSAPRKPFSPSYLRWRAFYMYGGGLMTDWGVHLTDIALLAMKADAQGADSHERLGAVRGLPEGPRAVPGRLHRRLAVRRLPHDVHQHPDADTQRSIPPERQLLLRPEGRAAREPLRLPHPAAAAERRHAATSRWRARGGRAGLARRRPRRQAPPPTRRSRPSRSGRTSIRDDPHTIAHARNFLDCVKSRKSPVADITTVGFHVTLPCLLGRLAVKEGRAFGWDGTKAV